MNAESRLLELQFDVICNIFVFEFRNQLIFL